MKKAIGHSSSEMPQKTPLTDEFLYANNFLPEGIDLFKNESTGMVIRKQTTGNGKFFYKNNTTGTVLFFEDDVEI